MEIKYKIFVINSLYGLMQGSAFLLEKMMLDNFKNNFGHKPDSLIVDSTEKFIEDDNQYKGCWNGSMTVTLNVNNEEYKVTRDWCEEYENDKKHPDFDTDDWFYESDKCFRNIRAKELIAELTQSNS